MKHLKKFNENKSEMQLEDYFVEFVDEGFTIERELNQFKLKYTGEYDFNQTLEMYNDVISKLQAYGKDITKTDLSYRKSVTNVLIEVKNTIKTNDAIEITLRGEKLKLIPHAYSIYGEAEPWQSHHTNDEGNVVPLGKPRPPYVNTIILFCKDENNRNYNITWENRYGNELSKEDIRAKVQNTNINIDLENASKVIETIKKNEIEARYGTEIMLDVFTNTITPELLTR
jgi:isopropylmalate/homocitrate/citramalate synthase